MKLVSSRSISSRAAAGAVGNRPRIIAARAAFATVGQ
jgi:hypothetical protein